MESKDQLDLTRMNRAVFEALEPAQLVELTCRLHTMAIELSERLALNSTNSSRPPSSDPPFGGGGVVVDINPDTPAPPAPPPPVWGGGGRRGGQRRGPRGRGSQRRCHAAG